MENHYHHYHHTGPGKSAGKKLLMTAGTGKNARRYRNRHGRHGTARRLTLISQCVLNLFFLAILFTSSGFFLTIDPVSAASDSAARGNCVISLRFAIEDAPVEGASFTCTRAGSYADFPEVRRGTAERVLREIAGEDGDAKSARFRVSGVTDERGELHFRGLPEGVYVIEGSDVLAEQYTYKPQPFLMSARDPEIEEPVTAQIKYERSGPDTVKPDPSMPGSNTPSSGKKLPQTGLQWAWICQLCSAGLLLIAAGCILRGRPLFLKKSSCNERIGLL